MVSVAHAKRLHWRASKFSTQVDGVVDLSQFHRDIVVAPPSQSLDFEAINAAAHSAYPGILFEWLPGGRVVGREYESADLNGGAGRSLKVNVANAKWSDFADEHQGGDPISLYAAINGLSQGDAARELADQFRVDSGAPRAPRPAAQPQAPTVIMPVPANAGRPDFIHPGFGQASQVWDYLDDQGRLLQSVARYDQPDGKKQIVPWTWNGTIWQMKHPSKPRPLYGLNRLAARPDALVVIAEGEKAVDAAQRLYPDAVAVSWSGGGNSVKQTDWTPLRGRQVAIWPDADEPGMKTAQGVASALEGIAPSIRVLDVGDKPQGWDAADAEAEGWTADDVAALINGARISAGLEPLKLVDPTTLEGVAIPEFKWLLDEWIPWGYVTALYGDGGTGKSLLAQQLMTAIATGQFFFGIPTATCRVLGYFCEDKEDEIHRRQASINDAMGVAFTDLGRVRWVSRVGEDNILMEFLREGTGSATRAYEQLRAAAIECGAQFVVLDTAADLFGGNENVRPQVRQFINLLARLAIEIDGAALLCAHPSASGMSSGEGSGGSTAWNNTVRSRLYLKRFDANDEDAGGDVDDLRILTRKKANYARTGEEIVIRWQDWAFVSVSGAGAQDTVARIEQSKREREAEQTFLDGLDKLHEQGRNASDSKNAHNYAPKVVAKMPSCGFKVRDLTAAMDRLLDQNIIEVGDVGTTKHRKKMVGLRRTEPASNPQETGGNHAA